MNKVTRNITVDLSRASNTRVVFATQNDLNSRRLSIRLTDDGAPYGVQSSLTATVNYKCSDGTSGAHIAQICDDGSIVYTIGADILSASGETLCSVSLFNENGDRLTSSSFAVHVADALYLGTDITENEASDLVSEIMSTYTEMENAETQRRSAESDRVASEEQRVGSEEQRITAESSRAQAEDARAAAEASRVEAEAQRQEYYDNVDEYVQAIEDIQNALLNENGDVGVAFVSLLDAYPVGSVYVSANETSPATLFGGTWEQLKDRFLLGAGDTYTAASEGGSAEHTHGLGNGYAEVYMGTLTGHGKIDGRNQNGIALTHKAGASIVPTRAISIGGTTSTTDGVTSTTSGLSIDWNYNNNFGDGLIGGACENSATALGGNTDNGSSLPPYLTVYMWKRVA